MKRDVNQQNFPLIWLQRKVGKCFFISHRKQSTSKNYANFGRKTRDSLPFSIFLGPLIKFDILERGEGFLILHPSFWHPWDEMKAKNFFLYNFRNILLISGLKYQQEDFEWSRLGQTTNFETKLSQFINFCEFYPTQSEDLRWMKQLNQQSSTSPQTSISIAMSCIECVIGMIYCCVYFFSQKDK